MDFQVKEIQFGGRPVSVVVQDDNGPCSLLAICNALYLKECICLGRNSISQDDLLSFVEERLIQSPLLGDSNVSIEQLRQKLPSLAVGFCLNPGFNSVASFEPTVERILFSLLSIQVFHCWVLNPGDVDEINVIKNMTYDQLSAYLISLEDGCQERSVITKFMEETATHSTPYGLECVTEAVQEGEIGILFSNNHFSTLIKVEGDLYSLVTDSSFSDYPDIVWERLKMVLGTPDFYNSNFVEWNMQRDQYQSPCPENQPQPPCTLNQQVFFDDPLEHGSVLMGKLPVKKRKRGASVGQEQVIHAIPIQQLGPESSDGQGAKNMIFLATFNNVTVRISLPSATASMSEFRKHIKRRFGTKDSLNFTYECRNADVRLASSADFKDCMDEWSINTNKAITVKVSSA